VSAEASRRLKIIHSCKNTSHCVQRGDGAACALMPSSARAKRPLQSSRHSVSKHPVRTRAHVPQHCDCTPATNFMFSPPPINSNNKCKSSMTRHHRVLGKSSLRPTFTVNPLPNSKHSVFFQQGMLTVRSSDA